MSEWKIRFGLQPNLWCTFDGRPLRCRREPRSGKKGSSAKLKAFDIHRVD